MMSNAPSEQDAHDDLPSLSSICADAARYLDLLEALEPDIWEWADGLHERDEHERERVIRDAANLLEKATNAIHNALALIHMVASGTEVPVIAASISSMNGERKHHG